MSAKIVRHPNVDAWDAWPGHADADRTGLSIAIEMFQELESNDTVDGIRSAARDYGCLDDWPREGRPFRNIVFEYLQQARAAGSDTEAGFCAALSDFLSQRTDGECQADRIAQMFGIE